MKTLTLCLLGLFGAMISRAQLTSGVYSASGTVSFSSSSSDFQGIDFSESIFSFAPGLAYFVADRVEISASPSYASISAKTTVPGQPVFKVGSQRLGAEFGLRYYFADPSVAPFAEVGGGLTWTKSTGVTETPFSPPRKAYHIAFGLNYFLTQTFALEPEIEYFGTSYQSVAEGGLFVGIGVKYFVLPE